VGALRGRATYPLSVRGMVREPVAEFLLPACWAEGSAKPKDLDNLALDLSASGDYQQPGILNEGTLTRRRITGGNHPHTRRAATPWPCSVRRLSSW
jgi:hypothetical protein